MPNSSYTFTQVLNGTGSFSKDGDTQFSQGVSEMQGYLKKIGYDISDPAGRFQTSTYDAVCGFQEEWGMGKGDGIAGQWTIQRLNVSRQSEYYTVYGKPITGMNTDNILKGIYKDDINLLARIIYAESGTKGTDTEIRNDIKGIGWVLRNRYQNAEEGGTGYCLPATKYPNASKWARIVAFPNQYSTCNSEAAMKPKRGVGATLSTVAGPRWKNAVDIAKVIYEKYWPQVDGYLVQGETILDARCSATDQMNQCAWRQYTGWLKTGNVSPSVDVITFSKTAGVTNVICTWVKAAN